MENRQLSRLGISGRLFGSGMIKWQVTINRWVEKIQKILTAITFAEANCPDIGREFLKDDLAVHAVMVPVRQSKGLSDFLLTIGLTEAKVWIGMVEAN